MSLWHSVIHTIYSVNTRAISLGYGFRKCIFTQSLKYIECTHNGLKRRIRATLQYYVWASARIASLASGRQMCFLWLWIVAQDARSVRLKRAPLMVGNCGITKAANWNPPYTYTYTHSISIRIGGAACHSTEVAARYSYCTDGWTAGEIAHSIGYTGREPGDHWKIYLCRDLDCAWVVRRRCTTRGSTYRRPIADWVKCDFPTTTKTDDLNRADLWLIINAHWKNLRKYVVRAIGKTYIDSPIFGLDNGQRPWTPHRQAESAYQTRGE